MMNPVAQVQGIIAGLLRECPWFADNRVEVIEQNKSDLRFLLEKQLTAMKNVVVVVGCDMMTNQYPNLELTTTITAIEYVPMNRASKQFVTAIDVIQAAIEVVDGEWWHFDSMSHESPAASTLQATASFRGCVQRVPGGDAAWGATEEGEQT